jgi:hypothetical protein
MTHTNGKINKWLTIGTNKFRNLGFRVQGSGFRGLGFRVKRFRDSGFSPAAGQKNGQFDQKRN